MGKGGGAITNRVRELRAERGGMTQQELADAVGVTRQTIHAMERAKYSPSLEVAFRVADALGVPIEQAFGYDRDGRAATGPAKDESSR